MPKTYTLDELQAHETIEQGHFDNLKIQTARTRVWLSRMTEADGMPYDNQVTEERLDTVTGEWIKVRQYPARETEDQYTEAEKTLGIYRIIRFYKDDRPSRTIKKGLTLEEAQKHCGREDTSGAGWFDGYDLMKGVSRRG